MLSGFSCGARRFEKYKFTTDKPSNPILHKENEQKLNDLLRIREEQDNRVFPPFTLKYDATTTANRNIIKIAETFVMPDGPSVQRIEHAAPLEQGQILYYPTSDVKEKKD